MGLPCMCAIHPFAPCDHKKCKACKQIQKCKHQLKMQINYKYKCTHYCALTHTTIRSTWSQKHTQQNEMAWSQLALAKKINLLDTAQHVWQHGQMITKMVRTVTSKNSIRTSNVSLTMFTFNLARTLWWTQYYPHGYHPSKNGKKCHYQTKSIAPNQISINWKDGWTPRWYIFL